MIFNMIGGGGSGLNIEIVNGTVQPDSPQENTLWVDTSTEIVSWSFQTDEPSTPSQGLLWIRLNGLDTVDINIVEENSFIAYLKEAKIYNNGAWERLDGWIYTNSAWAQFSKSVIIYGIKISKTDSNPATRVTYTDDAVGMSPASMNFSTGVFDYGDWGSAWFVEDNKPLMLKYDGTVDYYLYPSDYTKKEDGVTASDVANTSYAGNAMAQFPTVWFLRWEDNSYEYCRIANKQVNESYHAYAHQRADGSIMDYFYRAIYDGCNVSSKIRSISGQVPCNTVAGNTQLSYAQANGTLWESDTWSKIQCIWTLLILMGKSTNVQAVYGLGQYTGFTAAASLARSGLGNERGQFYGINSGNGVVKTFHCENIWGNIWKLCQGLQTNGSTQWIVKMTKPYNTSGTGYTNIGFAPGGTSGGYISGSYMSEYGLIPRTMSGSDSTYIPDGCWFVASCFTRFGGSGFNGLRCGLAVVCNFALSGSDLDFGVALTCDQPLAA